jgi:hypothetical protein
MFENDVQQLFTGNWYPMFTGFDLSYMSLFALQSVLQETAILFTYSLFACAFQESNLVYFSTERAPIGCFGIVIS